MASTASTEPVKIAALQMTSAADVALNLEVAARLLAEARAAGAQVAVLPENFSFMGLRDADKRTIAEPDGDGPVQRFLSQQARALGLWIVAGTTPIVQEVGGRVAAACLAYGDDGRRAARYDKMHMFDVDIPGKTESYRESRNTAPGSRAVLVPTPAGVRAIANRPILLQAPMPRWSRRRRACWACRCVMTCASPSCTGSCRRRARSGSRSPPPLPCRPARRTGKRCCAPGRSRT